MQLDALLQSQLAKHLHNLHVVGMLGLGDNIYQRAVLRTIPRTVFLETPWPQLYSDLPILCVRSTTRLRTQAKNVERILDWHSIPRGTEMRRVHYTAGGTMLQSLCAAAGVQPAKLTFDLPDFGKQAREPYIVIRPATIRAEWRADSRNPKPEYLAKAAERLRRDFRIISVADLSPNVEWPVLPLPYADETFHNGELGVEHLMSLVANAAAVIGGVGWLLPAAIAYRVPMLLIYGGQGIHNGPARIFDPRLDIGLIEQARPDPLCMCASNSHNCEKTIKGFDDQLERWAIRLAPRGKAAMDSGDRDRVVSSDGPAIRQVVLGQLSPA